MREEQRPLRELKRIERFLVRLGRCPTCQGKLESMPTGESISWSRTHSGFGRGSALPPGGTPPASTRHVDLSSQNVHHCPKCKHVFIHGWIYPIDNQGDECSK